MILKLQFCNDYFANMAFISLNCKKVKLGTAIVVDDVAGKDTIINAMVSNGGHTVNVTDYDIEQLNKSE